MAAVGFVSLVCAFRGQAQPLTKSAIQVDAGGTKQAGQTFGYRLTYNCSSTSGPCLNAEVVDLLPAEVQQVSTVPASPTGDVAAINVTPNFGGSGRTRVRFVLINPLPAGNSGDLIVNVRFPNGSTPNGTQAVNTADGVNLGTSPGTFTTPPVTVTAVAAAQVTLAKTLLTSPANLDLPETYRLRIANATNANGSLNLTAIGPVVDTLPPGTVFSGSTPAADCQPGCVGTTPATVTWTSPCTLPLAPGQNCDISVNVTFPSATFPSGTNVTNSFVADATPLGAPPQAFGPGTVTHAVTTFVPSPGATFTKNMAGGTPNPPAMSQAFSYDLNVGNSGNVPLDALVVIDTLPVELQVTSVTTGAYTGLADFSAGEGVRVSYEKSTAPGVFTLWGSSPNAAASTTLTAPPPGLGAGEYLTRVRWEYGQAQPGMANSTRPLVTGRIVDPDNGGGPVAIGDSIQNCAALSAVYAAGPANVSRNDCETFVLSGPFVQLNPAKENLSGAGPFNPGQAVSWRLRVRTDARSSDPVPLEGVVATDLLPVNLVFSSWTFDAQGTGLPAPQTFEQVPNFAGTGRTLLRWRWNAGSGSLGVNQQVWVNVATTVRSGAPFGSLSNDLTLEHDAPGLGQRCSGSSQADALDYDGDGNTAETLCRATGTITVAGIAQLVSGKSVLGVCDGGFGSSGGTLAGAALAYRLAVQNPGTVPMRDFVLVDILPSVGDSGVRDTTPRGSQWTPLLTAPVLAGPAVVVSYSTSGNPCRGEVGGPTTGCDAPNWTTAVPDPITSVRSVKFELPNRVINPGDFGEAFLLLTTPGDVGAGLTAYNSFAYQAARADGLGSLAAEPLKVGVALGSCPAASLGDTVWVDLDRDGLQDDGPTGLNGVTVRLFSPGADGLSYTFDDVPLATTTTGPGPTGAAGWYSFPGLAPGSYYVKVVRPPTFELTLRDAAADGLDSDGDPVTGASQVVTLAANETNPTLDFGLVATELAALGDFVWFDRDSDGVQDETPYDGANGVTVRLFIDDGDGVPERGGGDLLAAATVTADDLYGRPGFYLFDLLVPGLPYYVEFVRPASATGFTSRDQGGNDAADSDAAPADGTSLLVVLSPGEVNRTVDAGLVTATGTLALGDQVWLDADDDGVFEPQAGETGIDGVRLDLYLDADGDGLPTLDEAIASIVTQTESGFAGRYRFGGLAPGTYVVVVSPHAFAGGGALAGLVTSTGNDPAPDPDDDVNGDDNGTDAGALVASRAVTLTDNGEPTSEDGDADTNLTVDFGFRPRTPAAVPEYDYGDAPDVQAGTSRGDYQTTALGGGAYHRVGPGGAPYLGSGVDADGGLAQDAAAIADDAAGFGLVVGSVPNGDDEDGVTVPASVRPGTTATFAVSSGGPSPCLVDAWVDWSRNGVFGDAAGEHVAASLIVATGTPVVLTPTVPASAVPGRTYARFRCSTAGGLAPVGPAADGEVEDYALEVIGTDFGDAPPSYGTQGAGAASHTVDPLAPLLLGTCVDTEADGQPNAAAAGDDGSAGTSRVGSCFDDEDGVAFLTPLAACQTAQVAVTVTAAGPSFLDAFVDFNGDGDFADAGEQVFASRSVVAGANALSFGVPCAAVEGVSYARFRLSSAGGLGPAGSASDGEVEDYAVNVGAVDFGDAPDTYATTLAAGGPNHRVVSGFSLGATLDSEPNGQPSAGALGDGADEDGVLIPAGGSLTACTTVALTVSLTNTAGVAAPRLDAWIDFDGDGVFGDPRDRVATALVLTAGSNALPVSVPCDARSAASYARFRLSSTGVASPGGAASDGEVEDWAVAVRGLDFGDAPDPTYPTLLASNGARHVVLPVGNPTLGPTVDTEPDGQPAAGLSGDDANADDEDGVVFPTVLVAGATGRVRLTAGATGGFVSGWIDFDRDGSFGGAGEQVVADLPVSAGATVEPTFAVPSGIPTGTAVSRFRISTQAGLGVAGFAADGEVEDHPAPTVVGLPEICSALRLVSVERSNIRTQNLVVTLEVGLSNTGNLSLSDVQVTADLAAVFVSPAVVRGAAVIASPFAPNPSFDGTTVTALLAPGATLPEAGSGTITVVVELFPGGLAGPWSLSFTAEADSAAGPVSDVTQDGASCDADGDGDPANDDDPTPVRAPADLHDIPNADPWGLLVLAALVAAAGVLRLARSRA